MQVHPGDRIQLVSMENDPDPIPPGTQGKVTFVAPMQIGVEWDNGRWLMLAVPEDKFVKV